MPSQRIEVIAPNLKRRLSGVTATIVRLVPLQAQMIGIVATGPGLPETIPHVALWRVFALPGRKLRVWHARRNVEMLLGLFLRTILRKRFALVFTSASQRHHTGFTKRLIRRMDAVISTSHKTAAYLEQTSTVIHHGIDGRDFAPASDRAALRRELGLPDGALVGCFGRIRHQKGTDVFVDAMIALLPKYPDVTAIVLGRATEPHRAFLEDLRARIDRAGLTGRIFFPPEVPVDQVARWYGALDLFVAPQRWEGFGLTPLEAMSSGVPVVATRAGAFEELIVDGRTGTLVENGDLAGMTAAVDAFLADRQRLAAAGRAARDHCQQNFSLAREAERIVDLYQGLLGAPVLQGWAKRWGLSSLPGRLGHVILKRTAPARVRSVYPPASAAFDGLEGKTVSLVGNARALAHAASGAAIDSADIVIRINRAPIASARSHGMRTDWLGLATSLNGARARKIRPAKILWMSHKIKRLPYWACWPGLLHIHRLDRFSALSQELGAPPSTGVMLIDLLATSRAARIDLYGFDFFSSKSATGSRSAAQVPHDFDAERRFVETLLDRDPRFVLHSMDSNQNLG